MAKNSKQKNKLREKLTFKYRLVVLNEDTFEERFSFKLNRLNVFVFGSVSAILLVSLTAFLIAFTPLREYIPGYSSSKLKKQATDLVYQVDSLEQQLEVNDIYIQNIRKVLTGKIKDINVNKDSIAEQLRIEDIDLHPTPIDSAFRQQIEREDRFSVFEKATKKTDLVFSSPVKGQISDLYNPKEKHYAIDVAVKKGTPIKAAADGTVIFTGFTADTGFVIILEHPKNFITVYKHNETIHKEQGDLVKSGEVIGIAGSTGTLTTGPHLHFELWNDGFPINPINYIDFE